ncbi:hypothetical protein GALMADRAFT_238065 [Galerina marginata CBS 339.88]|uniref:Uncharacterized protein n=1 Tax=Galerina marginata (strain CBS 339.88) TaxID=685588 RepID=A0A067TRU3_GALM3|nr:hypothetical protein GALMADRAFT_238065 [Galerina marginata CBS 339.88]
MPRSVTEKSKSPERISYHLRSKPSMPIEIPKRRRMTSSPNNSPNNFHVSPDLIFEMSPLSPNFSPNSIHPAPPTSPDKNHEPFMYHAPSLRPYASGSKPQLRSKKSCHRVMPSRTPRSAGQVAPELHLTKFASSRRFDDGHVPNPLPDRCGTIVMHSTTKITGFVPLIEHQPLVSDKPLKPITPLPPPPRRSSFSSSPWILPGRGDFHEEDVSYSQADPSTLEFRNHLLRRMENRDSSRFKSLHSCL